MHIIYILQYSDSSYYTGMTSNLDKRIEEHHTGAYPNCFTFSRRPVILKYTEVYKLVYDAISREKQIKGWSRKKKEALMRGDYDELKLLAKNRVKSDNNSLP